MKTNKIIVNFLIILSFIGIIYWGVPLFLSSFFNAILISFCGLISILYVVRISGKSLREVPGLKVFMITIVYFVIACILPFQDYAVISAVTKSATFFLFLAFHYLYILGITILFDIPDVKEDNKAMRTLAQYFGANRTIVISLFLEVPLLIFLLILNWANLLFWAFLILHLPFYFGFVKTRMNQFYLAIFGEMMLLGLGIIYCYSKYI